jgi:hypothetical protein
LDGLYTDPARRRNVVAVCPEIEKQDIIFLIRFDHVRKMVSDLD